MNISSDNEGPIHLCQETFVHQLLERYGLQDLKPTRIPMDPSSKLNSNVGVKLPAGEQRRYHSMVGSLNYLATVSRIDISLATSIVARFCANPTQEHMDAVTQIYAYLKGTPTMGPIYKKNDWQFEGFVDSDWAGCPDTRRSTTGFAFMLAGAPISSVSRRQKTVALSSREAEYVAAAEALAQEPDQRVEHQNEGDISLSAHR